MEYDIVTILNNAGASDYIPNFSRHRVSIETLIQMSDDDLARVSLAVTYCYVHYCTSFM